MHFHFWLFNNGKVLFRKVSLFGIKFDYFICVLPLKTKLIKQTTLYCNNDLLVFTCIVFMKQEIMWEKMRTKYIKNSQFVCTYKCLSVLFLAIVFLYFSHFLVTKYKTNKGNLVSFFQKFLSIIMKIQFSFAKI